MQNSVNHRDFERTWHFQVSLGSMFLRVEFPPHLGGAPPRGGAAGGGLWRAFGCASLAEAGECGACAPGAGPAICPGWRSGGVASRWARAVPIGVLVASPRERRRSLMCRSISCRSGFTGDPFCERASASQPRHRCAAARERQEAMHHQLALARRQLLEEEALLARGLPDQP